MTLSRPGRSRAAPTVAALALAVVTGVVALVFLGRISLVPQQSPGEGTVFYAVPYHYGFAFYDGGLREIEKIEVKQGEVVTLSIVPALALSREVFLEYAERAIGRGIGGLAPGDSEIRRRIAEDLDLGNVEHIVGIGAYPVYVTTNVGAVLAGRRFREGGPGTLRDAVRRKDLAIKTVTFTAKRVGAFDVICVDSGMDAAGTCGWGHKWMVAKGAFVVR